VRDLTLDHIAKLEGATAERAFEFIYYLRAVAGVPVYITESRRSHARQLALFASGRLTSGPIVTKTLKSKHLLGRAFDIAIWGYDYGSIPREFWTALGQTGEQFGLKWGGRFKGLDDLVHFET
jgi:peptidoglycan L-alanyl-D-glutamate endopeptidase CwlK